MLSQLSYARWLTESVFTGETFLLNDSFKMWPQFFRDQRDSAFGLLILQRFRERFTSLEFLREFIIWVFSLGGGDEDDNVDDADDADDGGGDDVEGGFSFGSDYDTLHRIDELNVPTLIVIGLLARLLAFMCLITCNGTKMGRPSLWNRAVRPVLDRVTAAMLSVVERVSVARRGGGPHSE